MNSYRHSCFFVIINVKIAKIIGPNKFNPHFKNLLLLVFISFAEHNYGVKSEH